MPANFESSEFGQVTEQTSFGSSMVINSSKTAGSTNKHQHSDYDEVQDKLPRGFIILIGVCLCIAIVSSILFLAYNTDESTTTFSPSVCLIVGVLNSLIGSLLSASGYCCQKWAHLRVERNPSLGNGTSQPVYVIGLILLATGTISAVVNLGLLGQTVQSPFAALTLIYNALLARLILHESYSRIDFISSVLIISGVFIAVFGIEQSTIETRSYDLHSLLQLYVFDSALPLMYTFGVIGSILISTMIIRNNSLESSAYGLVVFSLSAGLMAGFTSLSVKSVVEISKSAATHDTNDLKNPVTYMFVVLIPASLLPQLYFMNQGLKHFGTLLFVPLYQSFIIIGNLMCGIIYFNELAAYSATSVVLFIIGCSISILGICVLLAKVSTKKSAQVQSYTRVFNIKDGIDCETIEYATDGVRFMHDFGECKETIVELFSSAKSTIFYSTFLCDFKNPLPVPNSNQSTSILQLITEAVERGVKVHILYNPVTDYGTCTVQDLLEMVPECVDIRCSVSDLGPTEFTKHFGNNSRYGFHHQKYLTVDGDLGTGRMMVTGCDVNEERNSWLKKNTLGYYWHEVSCVAKCSAAMYEWTKANQFARYRYIFDETCVAPPFPLVSGGWHEENIMVEMILKAQHSIHIENQIFVSGGNEQENRISEAIVERIARAVNDDEEFSVLILTNAAQQDEPSFLTRVYCTLSLEWSLQGIEIMAAKRGISKKMLYDRLLVGRLEHENVLIKVHSNFLIQDGFRCLRSSSNMADRSLSHFPCDAETGMLLEGPEVDAFQQTLLNRYFNTEGMDYSIKEVISLAKNHDPSLDKLQSYRNREVCKDIQGCIRPIYPKRYPRLATRAAIMFFIIGGDGATGGYKEVTLESVKGTPSFTFDRIAKKNNTYVRQDKNINDKLGQEESREQDISFAVEEVV